MFMVIFMFVCFNGLPRVQLFCLMVVLQSDVLTMFLLPVLRYDTIRYDTRCYFNVRSEADMSQLNLPHGNNN